MFHMRAGGHNILPFLEYFQEHSEHELHFVYVKDRTFYPDSTPIHFHKFNLGNLIKILRLLRGDLDLLWFHGGHNVFFFTFFSAFRTKRYTYIFNVWNEWLLRQAKAGSLKGRLFRWALSKADVIHCNWHGTAEYLRSLNWHSQVKVFYWGLHRDNFIEAKNCVTAEAQRFIAQLPKNKTLFFFPKSISPNSRHDLVIAAARRLRELGVEDFQVFFWEGNTNQEVLKEQYLREILANDLSDQVTIQEHGFLPFTDMQLIWKKMDAGLQIAANEQLSTTFLEPQFYGKEILATNIRPYQLYNQVFDLAIPLLPLEAEAIAEAMRKVIRGEGSSKSVIAKRQKVVQDNFNFTENVGRILKHYSTQKASLNAL